RPGVYRRLGDVSLFLTGGFPDYVTSRAFGPVDAGRLLRAAGLPAPERERLGARAAPRPAGHPARPPGPGAPAGGPARWRGRGRRRGRPVPAGPAGAQPPGRPVPARGGPVLVRCARFLGRLLRAGRDEGV